jgi:uncharacterized protein YegP (UPF0339 family)
MYFSLYRDAAYQWRWTLFAANNRKVADSGEGYVNKEGALHGIGLVMDVNRNTPVYER